MTEIILDEYKWCEGVLSGFDMGATPYMTIIRLARYYHQRGEKPSMIRALIEAFILKCSPMANLLRWKKCIDDSVRGASTPLVRIESIPIYQNELDWISELSGLGRQRLMFTLLCLAKFRNAVNPQCNGWVSCPLQDVFRMEGSQLACSRQYALVNDLLQAGYVELSRAVDNTNIRVVVPEEEHTKDPVMSVKDFRNLGAQYVNRIKGGFITCKCCGLTIRKSGNRQKYCRECARLVNARASLRHAITESA